MNGRKTADRRMGTLAKVVHLVAGLLLLGVGTAAAAAAAGQSDPGFQHHAPRIAFTDPAGNVIQAPAVTVDTAFPGMRPQVSDLTLRNSGEVAETFEVYALVSGASLSLDDVLVVNVTDAATHDTVFNGRFSDLAFQGTKLAAGETVAYDVRVTWPGSDNDNAYRGLGISFELEAVASAA
jgi:hypothetical protein